MRQSKIGVGGEIVEKKGMGIRGRRRSHSSPDVLMVAIKEKRKGNPVTLKHEYTVNSTKEV